MVEYNIDAERIAVEKGVYYAAWEKMKFLILPYLDVPIVDRVYQNGEIARTHFSYAKNYPGLFSSSHVPCNKVPQPQFCGCQSACYCETFCEETVSAIGIQVNL
jgi:hypothetical protein